MTSVIRVNPMTCEGHGLCAELFPERIRLDDWGFPVIEATPVLPSLEEHMRRAVDSCPTLALIAERTHPQPVAVTVTRVYRQDRVPPKSAELEKRAVA